MALIEASDLWRDWKDARILSLLDAGVPTQTIETLEPRESARGSGFVRVEKTDATPSYTSRFDSKEAFIFILGAKSFALGSGMLDGIHRGRVEATEFGDNSFVAQAADVIFHDLFSAALLPDYRVHIAGHSMGANCALSLAVRLFKYHPEIKVSVTIFGSPKPGNLRFARAWANRFYSSYFLELDPIPYFPADQPRVQRALFDNDVRVAPHLDLIHPAESNMLGITGTTAAQVDPPPDTPLAVNLALAGWAVGVFHLFVKAHDIATYERILYFHLMNSGKLVNPSIVGPPPKFPQGIHVPPVVAEPVPHELPPLERVPMVFIQPPPVFNVRASAGNFRHRRGRFRTSVTTPFNTIRLEGRWYVAFYGQLLFAVPGAKRSGLIARRLNAIVKTFLESGMSDADAFANAIGYLVGANRQ